MANRKPKWISSSEETKWSTLRDDFFEGSKRLPEQVFACHFADFLFLPNNEPCAVPFWTGTLSLMAHTDEQELVVTTLEPATLPGGADEGKMPLLLVTADCLAQDIVSSIHGRFSNYSDIDFADYAESIGCFPDSARWAFWTDLRGEVGVVGFNDAIIKQIFRSHVPFCFDLDEVAGQILDGLLDDADIQRFNGAIMRAYSR